MEEWLLRFERVEDVVYQHLALLIGAAIIGYETKPLLGVGVYLLAWGIAPSRRVERFLRHTAKSAPTP
jgi:hypothetical protein